MKPSESSSKPVSTVQEEKDTAEEGFITPAKGKEASANRGLSNPSLQAQNASNNPFAVPADTQKVATQPSPPKKSPANQPAAPTSSNDDHHKSSRGNYRGSHSNDRGSSGNKRGSRGSDRDSPAGPPQDRNTAAGSIAGPSRHAGPVLPQTAKTQELAKSPAPPLAPPTAKKLTFKPSGGPPTTPSSSEQTGAAEKLKQPQASSASSPVKNTAAEVLASPPPEGRFNETDLWLMEPDDPETETHIMSRLSARKAHVLALRARGTVQPTPPRRMTNGVHGNSTQKQSLAARGDSDEEWDEESGDEDSNRT